MVSEIITEIVSAFTTFLSGLGSAVVDLFEGLILDDAGKLTPFAAWGLAFLGLGLAVSLFYAILKKIG